MCSVLESAKNLATSAAAETEAASRLSKLHGDSALTLIRAARTLLKGRPEISAKLQTVINEVEDVLANACKFSLDLLFVVLNFLDVLGVTFDVLLLLDGGEDAPGSAPCTHNILKGDSQNVSLL